MVVLSSMIPKNFTLLEHEFLEFGLPYTQVAVLTKLRMKDTKEKFLDMSVSAVHMKAKKPFGDVRLIQGDKLLKAIRQFNGNDDIPTVIVGDFNDCPGSMVYELFCNGKASSSTKKEFQNPMKLYSSYSSYDNTGVEPYTTYKKREEEIIITIDYIFHSNHLVPKRLLEIPTIDSLKDRLPCAEYPSDHLQIIAELEFKQKSAKY